MKGSQTRTTLLVLAGAYLLYLAWEMLNTMRKGETEMQPWLSIVFIVFFTLAGPAAGERTEGHRKQRWFTDG